MKTHYPLQVSVPLEEVLSHGEYNRGIYSLYSIICRQHCGHDRVIHVSKYRSLYFPNTQANFFQAYASNGMLMFQEYLVSNKINQLTFFNLNKFQGNSQRFYQSIAPRPRMVDLVDPEWLLEEQNTKNAKDTVVIQVIRSNPAS